MLAESQIDAAKPEHRGDHGRPRVAIVAELCRGPSSKMLDAELVGLKHGCMRVVAPCAPDIGDRVSAEFLIAGKPIGDAAGYVVATSSKRGITIGLHHMSGGLHDLIDDVVRLRPSLRASFLAELVEARVRIT